jgi:hypothetical protein
MRQNRLASMPSRPRYREAFKCISQFSYLSGDIAAWDRREAPKRVPQFYQVIERARGRCGKRLEHGEGDTPVFTFSNTWHR